MKKLLEKISWKTRNINLKFHLLNLYLHDHEGTWGFELFAFTNNFMRSSLLAIEFRLPNKTHIQKFTVDSWDICYLHRPLWNRWETLDDRLTWHGSLNKWQMLQYKTIGKLFN